jgi:hypothetical protein
MENSMTVPQKTKIGLPCNPEVLILVTVFKELKTRVWKAICTPIFIAPLFTIDKI